MMSRQRSSLRQAWQCSLLCAISIWFKYARSLNIYHSNHRIFIMSQHLKLTLFVAFGYGMSCKECEFFQVETTRYPRSAIWQYFKDPWRFFKYFCPRWAFIIVHGTGVVKLQKRFWATFLFVAFNSTVSTKRFRFLWTLIIRWRARETSHLASSFTLTTWRLDFDDLTFRHLRDQPPSCLLRIAPRSDIRPHRPLYMML